MFKNKVKIILVIIASAIFVSGLSVYATYNYLAKDISYTKKDGTIISVGDALNELYDKTMANSEIIVLDSNRAEYEIPNNVKKVYVFVSRGTTNIPYNIAINGDGIINSELISNTSKTDVNMAVYIDIYKITLSGSDGKISLSCSGGSAASQAWNACVIY